MPQVRAPQLGANLGTLDDDSRIHQLPDFEQQLGLPPDADLDAETQRVLQKAEAEAQYRQGEAMPTPPPGLRIGSPAYRVYREEAYQALRYELRTMRAQLRDYYEHKRLEVEKLKKEMMPATPPPQARDGAA